MASNKVISTNAIHIDFANLCGGNDFAALTNGYNRDQIASLVWSIGNDLDRLYVKKAIYLQKKLDNCPEDDDDLFEKLLGEQVELQKDYSEAKRKEIKEITDATLQPVIGKIQGYTTRQWSVFFYYTCAKLGVYMKNDDCKNCDQNIAIKAIAKATGYKELSFTDMLNIDPSDSATRKAMYKVAIDLKEFLPDVYQEIMREYNEYEEDYLEQQRVKNNKKQAI